MGQALRCLCGKDDQDSSLEEEQWEETSFDIISISDNVEEVKEIRVSFDISSISDVEEEKEIQSFDIISINDAEELIKERVSFDIISISDGEEARKRESFDISSVSDVEEVKETVLITSLDACSGFSRDECVEERWIKDYCSSQKMLLVGEGDFSFSACLARNFGSAINMVATSLNSKGYLKKNYCYARSNIQELKKRGCMVIHQIDATEMSNYKCFKGLKFDRIIFNFPHAGFLKNESKEAQIRRNQKLISLFFENARKMISKNGEIHIIHKCNGFFLKWEVEALAQQRGLRLLEKVVFKLHDYPGYNTKYGFGGDKNFYCHPSKTYKFGPQTTHNSMTKISYACVV